MGSKNGEKRSRDLSEIEPSKERKRLKISSPSLANESLESTNSGAEEKSCLRECGSLIMNSSSCMDVENSTDSSSQMETKSPNQRDDHDSLEEFARIDKGLCVESEQKEGCPAPMAPSEVSNGSKSLGHDSAYDISETLSPGNTKQEFTGTDKGACVESEQKESCLAPTTLPVLCEESCLAPTTLPEACKESKSLGHDLAFDIWEELSPGKTKQDTQVMEKEGTQLLNNKGVRCKKVPKKDKKKPNHKVDQKKEFDELLRARADELKRVTKELTQELQRQSNMCMQLTDENDLLMAELKEMCEPCVMEMIEAKNPAKNAQ